MDNLRNEPPRKALKCDEFVGSEKISRKIEVLTINTNDVLCGRGKTSFNHVGNRRFRDAVTASLENYSNTISRLEKSMVVTEIVQKIKSTGGRFLKRDEANDRWVELDSRKTKEKVGHAIRDAISLVEYRQQSKKTKCEPSKSDALSLFSTKHKVDDLLLSRGKVIQQGNSSFSSIAMDFSDSMKYNNFDSSWDQFDAESVHDDFLSTIDDVLGPISQNEKENDPVSELLTSLR